VTAHYRRAATPDPLGEGDAVVIEVPADLAGMRLDQALARLLPQHSRNRLKAWIESGDVPVAGATVLPRHKLAGGESIAVRERAAPPGADAAEAMPLPIAYEDEAIVVVDKPAGLVVHPGAGNRSGTLLNALLHHLPALAALPRAGIVHRLDKDTSGLMVVAKTPQAQTDLVRQLQARSVHRHYVALAHGDLERDIVVDAPIGRHPVQRTTMAVVASGKPARTHVVVLERHGIASLVRCRLETGRTHQIRVHLASIGHPLVGDPVYRSRRSGARPPVLADFPRQALHAEHLALLHPVTRRECRWTAPLPADLAALIERVRRHDTGASR
jgi:23S rRNA pseudouridine1911/1915/1917 synthase